MLITCNGTHSNNNNNNNNNYINAMAFIYLLFIVYFFPILYLNISNVDIEIRGI